jgi:hypothetical protein
LNLDNLEYCTMTTDLFTFERDRAGPNFGLVLTPVRNFETRDAADSVHPPLKVAISHHERELQRLRALSDSATRGSRTGDSILTGNDPSPKRIALGTVWTPESLESLRDNLVDAIAELQSQKNFVLGEVLEPQDIEDLGKTLDLAGSVINLAHTYKALATDAAGRARAKDAPLLPPTNLVAKTFGPAPGSADTASDLPPHERTKDGRSIFGKGMPAAAYQENLRKHRATQDQDAPVAKARVTGPEFARLHDKAAARRAAEAADNG